MKTLAVIVALLLVAGVVAYLLLEKRPGYGAWYGLAKLTGTPLDIGPVTWATLQRHWTPNDALVCPAGRWSGGQGRYRPTRVPDGTFRPAGATKGGRTVGAKRV